MTTSPPVACHWSSLPGPHRVTDRPPHFIVSTGAYQAPESTAKKAFDFSSTVDRRRLSTLVYHSAHGISNIPSNIRRIFPADRLPLAGRQTTPGLGAYTSTLMLHFAALVIM
eukprot:1185202-Prorocentrum_minimum.AAC.1